MERRNPVREGLGLTLVLVATFALLSFASHQPVDVADIVYPVADPVRNAGGRVGAWFAHTMFFWLGGLASYGLVALLAAFGLSTTVTTAGRIRPWLRVVGGALFLASLAATDALLGVLPVEGLPPGGAVGTVVGPWFLRGNFGGTGATLILLYATICSLALATDLLFHRAVGEAVARARRALDRVRAAFAPKVLGRGLLPVNGLAAPEPIEADDVAEAAAEADAPAPSPSRPTRHRTRTLSARQDTVAREPAPVPAHKPPSARPPAPAAIPREPGAPFVLPPVSFLDPAETPDPRRNENMVREKGRAIERALSEFKVDARVVDVQVGPVITQYELQPGPGVKVSSVAGLSTDLARTLKAPKVRIEAPIPGRDTIGVEVPNVYPTMVRLSELMTVGGEVARRKMALPVYLGKEKAGRPLVEDLADMPHLLVAGASNSGKSVCLQTLITSITMTRTPDQVRFVLVDPKMVELSAWRDIPHLLAPVVTDTKKAADILGWLTEYMDRRYEWLAQAGVKNLAAYNKLTPAEMRERFAAAGASGVPLHPMPYIVLVIDEVGDLMLVAPKEVENAIVRLSQKARAVGIHVVLATQRPSADVLTGIIKANLTCRIAFQVTSRVNSQVILDQPGAEDLMGRGDMLFQPPRAAALIRAQGTFMADDELKRLTEHLRAQGAPAYEAGLLDRADAGTPAGADDPLFMQAVNVVMEVGAASASLLQRRLSVGYNRAAKLVEALEARGMIGPSRGAKPRELLVETAGSAGD